MRSSLDPPVRDRRLAAAVGISLLLHLVVLAFGPWFLRRPFDPPRDDERRAVSDTITMEKRVVPRVAVRVVPAPRPQRPRPQVGAAAAVPLPARPAPRRATIVPPATRAYQQRRPIAAAAPAQEPAAAPAAAHAALTAKQLAALDQRFSDAIAATRQDLNVIPPLPARPSTTKRYDFLMTGRPVDVVNAEGDCTKLDEQTRGGTSFVYYRCDIVYSDGFKETVSFPWPFRYPRGHVPLPGQMFPPQAPDERFRLQHPFAPSRAVCSFYKDDCAALFAREREQGAPESWRPRSDDSP